MSYIGEPAKAYPSSEQSLSDAFEILTHVEKTLGEVFGVACGIEAQLLGPSPDASRVKANRPAPSGKIPALLDLSRELHDMALGIRSTLESVSRVVG